MEFLQLRKQVVDCQLQRCMRQCLALAEPLVFTPPPTGELSIFSLIIIFFFSNLPRLPPFSPLNQFSCRQKFETAFIRRGD